MPENNLNDVFLMLGDHSARLKSIEATTVETGRNVRSLMDQFNTIDSGRKARAPYVSWFSRATSAVAAGLAGAWAALHFGLYK